MMCLSEPEICLLIQQKLKYVSDKALSLSDCRMSSISVTHIRCTCMFLFINVWCFDLFLCQLLEDYSLVMVMLCDFQSRKFQFRTPLPGETIDPLAQQVENAINQSKKKLNAALARHRIKASVTSVESLLPTSVRNNEEIKSKMPVYLWVNQWKTRWYITEHYFLSLSQYMCIFIDVWPLLSN